MPGGLEDFSEEAAGEFDWAVEDTIGSGGGGGGGKGEDEVGED